MWIARRIFLHRAQPIPGAHRGEIGPIAAIEALSQADVDQPRIFCCQRKLRPYPLEVARSRVVLVVALLRRWVFQMIQFTNAAFEIVARLRENFAEIERLDSVGVERGEFANCDTSTICHARRNPSACARRLRTS